MINKLEQEKLEQEVKDAINNVLLKTPQPTIVQHGENSLAYHISNSHSGVGDMINSNDSEIKKLRIKNMQLKTRIESKDIEISALKEANRLLREEFNKYKAAQNGLLTKKN